MKFPLNDQQVSDTFSCLTILMCVQIHRFQIRFVNEEHYYDSMKILSRFQIPTIEAGSFPQRPRTAGSAVSTAVNPQISPVKVDTRPSTAIPSISQTNSRQIAAAPVATFLSDASRMPPPPQPALSGINSQTAPDTWNTRTPSAAPQDGVILDSQPPATITTYTSRPSAAPTLESQHLSQELPPTRELPWEKSKTAQGPAQSRVLRSASHASLSPEPATAKESALKTKKAPARKAKDAVVEPATTKRKRAPSKKAKEALKPAQASKKARTGKDNNGSIDGDVPNILEVLRDTGCAPGGDHTSNKTLDTQALIARAEALNNPKTPSPRKRDHVLLESIVQTAVGVDTTATTEVDEETQSEPDQATHRDALIEDRSDIRIEVPASSAPAISKALEQASVALTSPLKRINTMPEITPGALTSLIKPNLPFACTPANQFLTPEPAAPTAPATEHTKDIPPGPTPFSASPPSPHPAVLLTTTPNRSAAYNALLSHPLFTPPISANKTSSDSSSTLVDINRNGLAEWARLPSAQRHEALQTWICEQYEDREGNGAFVNLCKAMEMVWEGQVVWPDLYRGTT
jgi:hypothetical protein